MNLEITAAWLKKTALHALFTITGSLVYYVFALPLNWLIDAFICVRISRQSCDNFWLVMGMIGLVCLPFCFPVWHRTGKRMWLKVFPRLAEAL